jgi:hypothetical protein
MLSVNRISGFSTLTRWGSTGRLLWLALTIWSILADWFYATVTIVGPVGSLRAFFENSLIDNASFAYPLLYDPLFEQVLDARSFFPSNTFQLAN